LKRPAKHQGVKEIIQRLVRAGRLTYSVHANQRLGQRKITKPEVEYILNGGHHEVRKDHFNEGHQNWDYAIRGKTIDGRILRIVVALDDPNLLVVTVIDLSVED
jgi:hypothetical protein